MKQLETDQIPSPIGTIEIVVDGDALCALDFAEHRDEMRERLRKRFGDVAFADADDPAGVTTQIRAYLAGDVSAFDATRVDPGGTPFQQQVWAQLRRVPLGQTRSYAEIARAIGRPKAARAVGNANNQNPIALAIPCHRIVPATKGLGGYAGGEHRKRWLLAHESATPPHKH